MCQAPACCVVPLGSHPAAEFRSAPIVLFRSNIYSFTSPSVSCLLKSCICTHSRPSPPEQPIILQFCSSAVVRNRAGTQAGRSGSSSRPLTGNIVGYHPDLSASCNIWHTRTTWPGSSSSITPEISALELYPTTIMSHALFHIHRFCIALKLFFRITIST